MGMVHPDLASVERPAPDALPEWTGEGDIALVGPLNDRAYGFGTDSFTRAMRRKPGGATHVYVAYDDGAAVGCLLMIDDDAGNSDLECVAVLPEARGRGISGNLLRHALADAAERRIETSTLVATRLGYPVYEQAGYRAIEPVSMWQREPRRLSQTTSTDSSNMTSPSSMRCTGHLAPICISRSRWSSGSSLGRFTVILKRVGEPRCAGS